MTKNWKKVRWDKNTSKGTSLNGYIYTTYQSLVNKLGKPIKYSVKTIENQMNKIQVHWTIKFTNDGTIATIYDYNSMKSPSNIHKWHIGGRGQVLKNMKELFPKTKIVSYEEHHKRKYGS